MKNTLDLSLLNLDPATLSSVTGLVEQLLQEREKLQQEVSALQKHNQFLTLKTDKLVLELANLKRLRFGKSSESLPVAQRYLFEDDLDQDLLVVESAIEQANALENTDSSKPALDALKPSAKKRNRAGRQALPDHLERVDVVHEPVSCTCAKCQSNSLVKIGEDITEQLDIIPAKFIVTRHIRPQYACRSCESMVSNPVAPSLIEGGMATTRLLAWVIGSKYLDHLPIYRLEQIAQRQGVILSRSTMNEWVAKVGMALEPLSDRLQSLLLSRTTLHADETPVQQLDPGKGKTKRAYLWAYRSNDLDLGSPMVVFDYQTSRSGQHAKAFLTKRTLNPDATLPSETLWQGHLMVDDYAGYKTLFSQGIIQQGCWAHARRKFYELHAATQHPLANEMLTLIAKLYAVETNVTTENSRQALRHTHSKPVLTEIHHWLMHHRPKTASGSTLAKAMDYLLRRWEAYCCYADTGHLPIDNNPVENAIRPIALGKKNWLFTGTERSGQRAAAIQSLLGTAKLNGIEPMAWLQSTLERLPTCLNKDIDSLLPLKSI